MKNGVCNNFNLTPHTTVFQSLSKIKSSLTQIVFLNNRYKSKLVFHQKHKRWHSPDISIWFDMLMCALCLWLSYWISCKIVLQDRVQVLEVNIRQTTSRMLDMAFFVPLVRQVPGFCLAKWLINFLPKSSFSNLVFIVFQFEKHISFESFKFIVFLGFCFFFSYKYEYIFSLS